MSVVSCTEQPMERTGAINESAYDLQRVYLVTTDDPNDDAFSVYAGGVAFSPGGFQDLYTLHPTWSRIYVAKIDPKPFMDPIHWKVTVSYKQVPPGWTAAAGPKPWDHPVIYSYGTTTMERVCEYCYSEDAAIPGGAVRGTPNVRVTNSAGQLFDPPVMETDYLNVISAQRWKSESSWNPSEILDYSNTINNASVTIGGITIPQWCGWCRDYKASQHYIEATQEKYFALQIEIVVNQKTWIKWILDAGIMKVKSMTYPGTATWEFIRDTNGKPISEPVPLDGAGNQAPNQAGPPIGPALHWQKFHVIWEKSWSGWLPSSKWPITT